MAEFIEKRQVATFADIDDALKHRLVPTNTEAVATTCSGRVWLMGTSELVIVAVVVLVLFGGSQLPKLAKNLGSAQRELKKAMEEGKEEGKAEPGSAEQK